MSLDDHAPAPRPWRVEVCDDAWVEGVVGADGRRVVTTDCGVYPPGIADAHLIAAAPELLAAVEGVLNLLAAGSINPDMDTGVVSALEAALRKARGEEEP